MVFEMDWWDYVLSAGACWRAARSDPERGRQWELSAAGYSHRAATLLAWDIPTWRSADVNEPR